MFKEENVRLYFGNIDRVRWGVYTMDLDIFFFGIIVNGEGNNFCIYCGLGNSKCINTLE